MSSMRDVTVTSGKVHLGRTANIRIGLCGWEPRARQASHRSEVNKLWLPEGIRQWLMDLFDSELLHWVEITGRWNVTIHLELDLDNEPDGEITIADDRRTSMLLEIVSMLNQQAARTPLVPEITDRDVLQVQEQFKFPTYTDALMAYFSNQVHAAVQMIVVVAQHR